MKLSLRWLAPALLIGLLGMASAQVWHWHWGNEFDTDTRTTFLKYFLADNSGGHAVAMGEYDSANTGTKRTWVSILAESLHDNTDPSLTNVRALEYSDLQLDNGWHYRGVGNFPQQGPPQDYFSEGQVALNGLDKIWLAVDFQTTGGGPTYFPALYSCDPYGVMDMTPDPERIMHSADLFPPNGSYAVAMFRDNLHACEMTTVREGTTPPLSDYWMEYRHSDDGGTSWSGPHEIVAECENLDAVHPSLVANNAGNHDSMMVAFDWNGTSPDPGIYVYTSADYGEEWPGMDGNDEPLVAGAHSEPCLAALDRFVFLCWTSSVGTIQYTYSPDFGEHWAEPRTVLGSSGMVDVWYDRPNATMVSVNGHPGILLAARVQAGPSGASAVKTSVRAMFGQYYGGHTLGIIWRSEPPICSQSVPLANDLVNPNVAAIEYGQGHQGGVQTPHACYVRSYPWLIQSGTVYGRSIVRRGAYWTDKADNTGVFWNTARRLSLGTDGTVHFATDEGTCYEAGEMVQRYPLYSVAGMGSASTLGVDGDGQRWVAFISDDTVYCHIGGELAPRVAFAGSSSAVPGQPSIVCYPNQANGVYVGAVTFSCYDTAGGTSKIMFARVDTSAVVLDTIESAANLRDSLPCINVYRTDSLLVTWQHGDSTLSSMLCDYGPGTAGQVPAWSSPSLVTATGYHPMSVMENGSVLNCAWTQKSGSNYSIERASCDLASAMFGSWTSMATPGGSSSFEKANSVYAGAGVSVWQQMGANGKWIIKGYVRGAETTFVANDTDAYHPHAVAESSAISPSIDQVRVHLLYSAGVTFEVDSGVYDTGETRYVCESLSVSHAGSNATRYNNGAKLLQKNGSDSLFAVYSDADGAVAFAWSAAGDSWRREIMATGRENPTIAEDSTGKRWVVVVRPAGINSSVQEAYYRNGASWTGPQTLYTNAVVTIGPASLAGASSTTSSIAYAAFLNTSGVNKSVVVAKFNGTTVSTYTLATGTTLGDPAIAVEPYKTDSDHVHVIWDDNGIVKYSMAADSRGSSISTTWTTPYVLTGGGVTGHHSSIGANRSRIVVAWAQGTTADIYGRKRASSNAYNNWENAANLSNTANNASDWPTIAMGDTVVVAWEETRTPIDHDVMACIEFGDTLNIADNTTVSGYPHIIFQNVVSGDTAIPYLHTIFSETPDVSYYEVRYNKLNLKHPTGEGQQSASSIPIPVKPALASCSPNPFRNHTRISYALPTAGNVSLRVYDVTGRTVRTLASGSQKAGSYTVSWDARDSHGKQVPYGVYFYRLDTPGFRSVKKAVVTR